MAAVATTLCATVLIAVQTRLGVGPGGSVLCHNVTVRDGLPSPSFPSPSFDGYASALSTVIFAYGGLSTFPTVQADMTNKDAFKYAALSALAGERLSYHVNG